MVAPAQVAPAQVTPPNGAAPVGSTSAVIKAASGFEVDPEIDAINKISKIMGKLEGDTLLNVKAWLKKRLV